MDTNNGNVNLAVDMRNPEDVGRALSEAYRQIQALTASSELLTLALTASMFSIEALASKAFDDPDAPGHMRAAFVEQIDAAWEKLGPHPLLTQMRKIATAKLPCELP